MVLLGASNLAAGLREVAGAARAHWSGPVEIYAAAGKGRSYGQLSHFLGRVLPGIDACGLWPALDSAARAPTAALVTDLGNDLAFGASAEQVQRWLEIALDRLSRHDARVVVTGLPLASLERMPAWEFRLWASVLFPWHEIVREQVLEQARELDARLEQLSRARGLTKVDPQLDWYGHDPIHVKRSARARAWGTYTAPWGDSGELRQARAAEFHGRVWYEQVRVLGLSCGVEQPCARFDVSSSLRLY